MNNQTLRVKGLNARADILYGYLYQDVLFEMGPVS